MPCAACGTQGEHSKGECVQRRPKCHRGCGKPTCIQAMAHGCLPTCIDCFFDQKVFVLDRSIERCWEPDCGLPVQAKRRCQVHQGNPIPAVERLLDQD